MIRSIKHGGDLTNKWDLTQKHMDLTMKNWDLAMVNGDFTNTNMDLVGAMEIEWGYDQQ